MGVEHDLGLHDLSILGEELLELTLSDGTGESGNVEVVSRVHRTVIVTTVRQSGSALLPATTTTGGIPAGAGRAAAVAAGRTVTLLARLAVTLFAVVAAVVIAAGGALTVGDVAVVTGGGRILPDWACQALGVKGWVRSRFYKGVQRCFIDEATLSDSWRRGGRAWAPIQSLNIGSVWRASFPDREGAFACVLWTVTSSETLETNLVAAARSLARG